MAFLLPPFSRSTFHGHPHYPTFPQPPTPPPPTTIPATRASRHGVLITLPPPQHPHVAFLSCLYPLYIYIFFFLAVPPLLTPPLDGSGQETQRLSDQLPTLRRADVVPEVRTKADVFALSGLGRGVGLKRPSNEAQMKCEWPNHSMGPPCIRAGQAHGVFPRRSKEEQRTESSGDFS